MAKKKNINNNAALPPEPAQQQPPTKLFTNLIGVVRQLVSGKNYRPLSLQELMQKLHMPSQHIEVFAEVLQSLIKENVITLSNGRYTFQDKSAEVVIGIVRMHPRGFGFVKVNDSKLYPEDIFIPKHLTMNAVDGDTVEVVVNTEVFSEKGPEGKIAAILSRSRTHIAGVVSTVSLYGEVLVYAPLLGVSQRIVVESNGEQDLNVGDRIVMEVIDWGSKETETVCRFSHHIGHISDPSCDIPAAIEEFELRADFPSKAVKEAQSLGAQVSRADIAQREDIRDWECVTIDPDTAKDFDDALTLTKDDRGHYHLGVHIADVSHYVQAGTALDEEARIRCNSTYFPGFCLPMLPSELSENLCSLKEGVNRLTVSVFMHFNAQGNLLNNRISRTVIKSAKRFTYREAKEVLDGKKKSKHVNLLNLMVELCQTLKVKRYERGSIEFALPELVVIVDANGVPVKTDYIAYDVTHQMVEEFMLKANEIVALHLSNQGKGVAYRIHDEPSEENMKDFSMLANAFGFDLSEKPTARQLQELFDEALQTPYGQYLATSYIRRMRQAMYSPENIGHYGLGLTHYCHFTSPIRRYVDLVVHRSLFAAPEEADDLDRVTFECSEQERISAKAENRVVLLKKLRLLDKINRETPSKQYEAVVTNVKMFGFSFEVLDFLLDGFLHVSELDQDYFIYDENNVRLRGRHTGKVYSSGERITLMLKEVDFILLDSKWNLVSEYDSSSGHRDSRGGFRDRDRRAKPKEFETKKKTRAKPAGPSAKKSKPSKKAKKTVKKAGVTRKPAKKQQKRK